MELLIPRGTDALLRDLVQERTGMLYDHNKESLLLEKLAPRVIELGFHSFLDYYYLLKYDENNAEEWEQVIDKISVQETFFWREMDQVRSLVDILIPEWAKTAKGQRLRIWSAGCATGEEPLTLAMAIAEAGWLDTLPIEIFATDASRTAIKKARAGLYRERAFRNLPPKMRDKYFAKEQGFWRVDPKLHKRITWDVANLINDRQIGRFASVPFIFCRNVFIYFSRSTISRVVRSFAQHMQSPAYVFVGTSESLLKNTTDFDLMDVGSAFVYKRSSRDGSISHCTLVSQMKGHG